MKKEITIKKFKVETFVPYEALENVKNALYECGFGKIGNYDCCMNWYEVNSSWKPIKGANPYIGEIGKIEFAKEYKIEFICEEKDLKLAVDTIKNNHSYEEVAINILPLLIY